MSRSILVLLTSLFEILQLLGTLLVLEQGVVGFEGDEEVMEGGAGSCEGFLAFVAVSVGRASSAGFGGGDYK